MKHISAVIFFICVYWPANSQSQGITTQEISSTVSGIFRDAVLETYQQRQFRPAWSSSSLRKELENYIAEAELFGLRSDDYTIRISFTGDTPIDIRTDIKYTEAAIHLLHDLACGNSYPDFGYRGLEYYPEISGLPGLLNSFADQDNFRGLAERIQPAAAEYRNALLLLRQLIKQLRTMGFKDEKVISSKATPSNQPLIRRLIQLGFIEINGTEINDSLLRSAIKKAQEKFDLVNDGKVRSTLITALNIPVMHRIREMNKLLNIIRWSSGLKENGPSVFLNIPSANFMLYDNQRIQLFSKVITGKRSTPTPTLTSTIQEVILYPYWVVPYKIATRELLPRIKRDISYLDRNHFQIINRNGRQMAPQSIRWSSLSRSYFPYTLRQATGCDNSLGLIKFDFQNPYSVYLHDTPGKELFEMNKRFFSHGCMRVEKPVELAHILLGDNRQAIDTLTEKGCLFNQKPRPLEAEKKVRLAVLYSTAWYNQKGEIIFYEDVYRKSDSVE